MSDTALMKKIIQGVCQHAQKQRVQKIKKIRLRVGEKLLSQEEMFKQAFYDLAQNTLLEKTDLELTPFPGSSIKVISFDVD